MVADEPQPNIVLVERLHLLAEIEPQQPHQVVHFRNRPLPVFRREGVKRQERNAKFAAGRDRGAHGIGAAPVACHPRQAARASPAAIAIHDDGDVPDGLTVIVSGALRRLHAFAQTCMISCSLALSSSSMALICSSVAFCRSSAQALCSSWLMSLSFSSFFKVSMPSRRTLRTAMRPCSAYLPATLVSS